MRRASTRCKSIQFLPGFKLDNPPDLRLVNAWNGRRRWGHVHVEDPGTVVLRMDASADGVTSHYLDALLELWAIVLDEFRKDFGIRQASPATRATAAAGSASRPW